MKACSIRAIGHPPSLAGRIDLEQLTHADTEAGQDVSAVQMRVRAEFARASVRVEHGHRPLLGPEYPHLLSTRLQEVLHLGMDIGRPVIRGDNLDREGWRPFQNPRSGRPDSGMLSRATNEISGAHQVRIAP